jgi:hypothetical protein
MGALASVNHLHLQFWHFDLAPDGRLPIERAHLRLLTDDPLAVFELEDYPIRALAFDVRVRPRYIKPE